MATRARHASTAFLAAAQKVISDTEKARKAAQRLQRREQTLALRRNKALEREADALFKSDFAKYLDPLNEVMLRLPARNGNEFLMGGTYSLAEDWSSKENKRVMDLHFLYGKVAPRYNSQPVAIHPLEIYDKATSGVVHPALSDKPVLKISLAYDFLVGEKIIAQTVTGKMMTDAAKPYYKETVIDQQTLRSFADIPAAIGRWAATVAPERIPDLKQAMRAKPKPTPPAPKP